MRRLHFKNSLKSPSIKVFYKIIMSLLFVTAINQANGQDRVMKVMPLGNSITDGYTIAGGYRLPLWQNLETAGLSCGVDFVGTLSNNSTYGLDDSDHEGHSGWTTGQILEKISDYMTDESPDIVMMHLGTNDIAQGVQSEAPENLRGIIDSICAKLPADGKLYVAQIIPIGGMGDANSLAYNQIIEDAVAEKQGEGLSVYLVDAYSIWSNDYISSDWTHPNQTGYNVLGDFWFDVIKDDIQIYCEGFVPVTSLTVNPTSATIDVDSTLQVIASVIPGDATNNTVLWHSSDINVATVDENGRVTAKFNGTAIITAATEDNSFEVTCTVTVTGGDENIGLNRPVTASSSASTVNGPGNITDGNTATRWSSTYSDPQWIYIDLGDVYSITRIVIDWETAYAESYKIQVSNDAQNWDDVYSTISGDGDDDIISELNVLGRFVRVYGTERATSYGYSIWEMYIYGHDFTAIAVQNVAVSPDSLTINSSATHQLSAIISPSDATNKMVTWSSSNESVASVSSSGLVTGKLPGNAFITVTTQDGNYPDTSFVTVQEYQHIVEVAGIVVSPSDITLSIAGTRQLSVTVLPADATNKDVSWSSDNESVATVNDSGLVTAKSIGKATIKVLTGENQYESSTNVTVVNDTETFIESCQDIDFQIFPNPTTGNVYLKLTGLKNNIRIKITGMDGRVVYQKEMSESGIIYLKTLHLPKGIYNVTVLSSGFVKNKFLILE